MDEDGIQWFNLFGKGIIGIATLGYGATIFLGDIKDKIMNFINIGKQYNERIVLSPMINMDNDSKNINMQSGVEEQDYYKENIMNFEL